MRSKGEFIKKRHSQQGMDGRELIYTNQYFVFGSSVGDHTIISPGRALYLPSEQLMADSTDSQELVRPLNPLSYHILSGEEAERRYAKLSQGRCQERKRDFSPELADWMRAMYNVQNPDQKVDQILSVTLQPA